MSKSARQQTAIDNAAFYQRQARSYSEEAIKSLPVVIQVGEYYGLGDLVHAKAAQIKARTAVKAAQACLTAALTWLD